MKSILIIFLITNFFLPSPFNPSYRIWVEDQKGRGEAREALNISRISEGKYNVLFEVNTHVWETISIQRSADGVNWFDIEVISIHDTDMASDQFTFIDNNLKNLPSNY